MAINSKIEWTHHTANLWWGCVEVHEGCDNCYARTLAHRYGTEWGAKEPRKRLKKSLSQFIGMQHAAHAVGEVHRVFVGSMMDIFEKPQLMVDHEGVPATDWSDGSPVFTDALRDQFFNTVVPACPNLMFLLLTKRPSNINKYIPESWKDSPPDNVMFGASVVNQKTARDVHHHLSQVNGRKFYSVEPQLEYIDFQSSFSSANRLGLLSGIDWLIQGGESGPKRRPFNTDWARDTRDYCAWAGVPYFFKQVDKVLPIPEDLLIRQFPPMQTLAV